MACGSKEFGSPPFPFPPPGEGRGGRVPPTPEARWAPHVRPRATLGLRRFLMSRLSKEVSQRTDQDVRSGARNVATGHQ